MEILLVFLYIILFIFKRREILQSPFEPWNLTILVWFIVLVGYNFQNQLYNLTDAFYISLFFWVLGFYLSSKFSYTQNYEYQAEPVQYSFNNKIILAFDTILILTLPLYVNAYLAAVGGFSFDRLFEMRNAAVEGDIVLGWLSYVPPLCKALLLAELYRYEKGCNIYYLLFAFVVNLVAACVIMEKGYLGFIFISFMYFFFKKNLIRRKLIIVLSLIFLVLMVVFNVFRSANDLSEANAGSFFTLYLVSPSVAFTTLTADSSPYFGAHTLRFFYALFHAFGFGPEALSHWQEPVYIPIRTNVYTVMEPYYEDFGFWGVLIFSIIIGSFIGWLYKKTELTNKPVYVCCYAFFLHSIAYQFFQEAFFVSISTSIQIAIFIMILSFKAEQTYNIDSYEQD